MLPVERAKNSSKRKHAGSKRTNTTKKRNRETKSRQRESKDLEREHHIKIKKTVRTSQKKAPTGSRGAPRIDERVKM